MSIKLEFAINFILSTWRNQYICASWWHKLDQIIWEKNKIITEKRSRLSFKKQEKQVMQSPLLNSGGDKDFRGP